MTNKLVVVINRLKYQKWRKCYHMKWNFLYCTRLQLPPEPLTRGLPSPDPRSLCLLSSTEFVDPPEKNSWVRHCKIHIQYLNKTFVDYRCKCTQHLLTMDEICAPGSANECTPNDRGNVRRPRERCGDKILVRMEQASNGSRRPVAAEDGDKCFLLCDPLNVRRKLQTSRNLVVFLTTYLKNDYRQLIVTF